MKLAVCAQDEGLAAAVDQRFGRCAFFVIVDPEKSELIDSVRNAGADAAGGAGPQAAQLLAGLDVGAVILGNVGPNAAMALEAAKITIYTGLEGTVESTMQKFREGRLSAISEATVSPHSGMKG